MTSESLMQRALGNNWHQLPASLQAHYQYQSNTDNGHLDIEFPFFMFPLLTLLRLLGVLINRRGKRIPTLVQKNMDGNIQRWHRRIQFPDGKTIHFNSFWIHAGGNELIEFVNPVIGLRMAVEVKDKQLHYTGKNYVIQIGKLRLPIAEWLVLGHTTIIETAVSATEFEMDFRLHHPLFGEIFRYAGKFTTT